MEIEGLLPPETEEVFQRKEWVFPNSINTEIEGLLPLETEGVFQRREKGTRNYSWFPASIENRGCILEEWNRNRNILFVDQNHTLIVEIIINFDEKYNA